jgi:glyoxylase-like metal-dependent hydrolase (beta-lactamase superfamily II)
MTQGEFLAAHALIEGRAGLSQADVRALFARHGMAAEHLASLEARGNHYRRGVPEAPHAFARLIDGDTVTMGDRPWRVIAGYGHSPEHAALAASDAKLLIAGDMLLPRISTNVAVWPGEPDGDPVARFLGSLTRFEALPAQTLVLPSHGPPFRGIAARVGRLRAHHAARLDELQQALATAPQAQSAAEIIPVLFRRELDLQQRFFAMGEAIAHLNHLWRSGRATRSIATDGAIRYAA